MIPSTRQSAPRSQRLEGVDVARALALVSMLDAHAYDGWVVASARASPAFIATRLLATFALPGFFSLAGLSLALRATTGIARGHPTSGLRMATVRRGFVLLAGGYGLSAVCAVVDGGFTADTVLRADVLHALGLGLALTSWFALRPPTVGGAPDARALGQRSVVLAALLLLACPWLSRLGAELRGPLRYPLALLIDVPGVTRMPLVPLGCFVAAGVPFGLRLGAAVRSGATAEALAWRIALPLGAASSVLGWSVQRLLLTNYAIVPARTNFAIVPNAVDLLGRALLLMALGLWLAPRLPVWLRSIAVALGRRSLVLYVLHLPLCYGRLARPFAHRLSMPQATLGLMLLVLACATLARLAERSRAPA